MFRLFKACLLVLFLISTTTVVNSDTNWITKKSDKSKQKIKLEKKIKKDEIKKKSEWIKKKKKENKKEYKKEEKKITKEVKSWITKKSKDRYIDSFDKLPGGAIYFTASNEAKDLLVYGYVTPDTSSKLIKGYHETSKGFGYFNDGKTTCKIGSTVIDVSSGEVTARVSGECTNGIKFAGKTSQNQNSGWGMAKTSDGKNRFIFDFNIKKTEIAKIFDKNKKIFESADENIITRSMPKKDKKKIILEPNGNYYALLIGNSKYDNGWQDLTSPVSDINAIKSVLDKSYKFKKILTVENGSKKQIYNAFKELSKLTTTNDYVLIYYSGHGKIKAEQAYWIPADGSKEWGNGDWINISELDIFLTEIKAHHLAVLVDSCFVGSKFKGINIIDDISISNEKLYGESLSSALNLRTRSVLSSGTTGQVSDTVAGTNHSRFALAILNMLNQFNEESYPLNLELLASLMKNYSYAGTFQKPLMYHPDTWQHGGGDFIFIPKNNLK